MEAKGLPTDPNSVEHKRYPSWDYRVVVVLAVVLFPNKYNVKPAKILVPCSDRLTRGEAVLGPLPFIRQHRKQALPTEKRKGQNAGKLAAE